MAKSDEIAKAAGSAAAGAGVVAASGFTAIGAIGGGAGMGAAAGPVGIAVGALAGLAFYGISKALSDD